MSGTRLENGLQECVQSFSSNESLEELSGEDAEEDMDIEELWGVIQAVEAAERQENSPGIEGTFLF